jgi:rhodanese-related sulfurtransferase
MFSFFSRGILDYNIDANIFSQKLKDDNNQVLLDVRTRSEYISGHIPGSVNMDIHDNEFQRKIENLDKTKNYYVYCRSGSRSLHACKVMKAAGFNVVYNLRGGILEWPEPLVS